MSCYYGVFRAVRNIDLKVAKQRDHGAHRAVGLRQVHGPADDQPDERPRARRTGPRATSCSTARTSTPRKWTRSPCGVASAWSSRSRTRSRRSVWENVAFGPEDQRLQGRHGRARRAQPPPRRAVGRRQGQAQAVRDGAVRRPAAAVVHRPDDRRRAGGHPHGRAVLGARSAQHPPDRGAHGRAQEGLHDRHRDPQHAAGRPRVGHDGVHDDGRRPGRLRRGERRRRSRSSRTRRTS